jgi:hypothetical protein
MNLQIERPYIEALISEFPRLAPLMDQLRFGRWNCSPAPAAATSRDWQN